jgi:predicted nuclease of predicted toxin-antitoxin system
VKFLLDENQSPQIARLLVGAGHDAIHVRDVHLRTSLDIEVLAAARHDGRVLISGDTDFGELLAISNAAGPSIVLLRRQGQRRADEIASLILANLDAITSDLESGAVVVFDDERIRIRRLPLRPD